MVVLNLHINQNMKHVKIIIIVKFNDFSELEYKSTKLEIDGILTAKSENLLIL